MKKYIFYILGLVFCLYSCAYIRMDDSINLGDNYRFIQDFPQTIIYHTGKKYKGVGEQIIPPIVLSYSFNDQYIIAKSQEVDEMTGSKEGKPIRYWIIDKNLNGNPVKPMDSVRFYKTLKKDNISLSFKK